MINGEEIQDDPLEFDCSELVANIYNLCESLNVLNEIDSQLLNKTRQGKLSRMKRQIFDSLSWYCEQLPIEDSKEEN